MSDDSLHLALRVFRDVLCSGWAALDELAEQTKKPLDQLRADWAQANWESIVEVAVSDGRVFLEPYGDGADCNPVGSRVWMPDVTPNHAVICHPSAGVSAVDWLRSAEVRFPSEGLTFDRFASLTREGWWTETPPFDHVLTLSSESGERLFRMSEVRFTLRRIDADA